MDSIRIETIVDWEIFKIMKKIQKNLRFVNFYRKFIKTFSQLIMPLTNLVKKITKFDWPKTTNEVFSKLKQIS